MAEVLKVTVAGYYSWLKRLYKKDDSNQTKIREIVRKVYLDSNCVYGSLKISKVIKHDYGITVNHKKVASIMRKEKIISKSSKKYKATTNSKHSLPIADNILNRDFKAVKPNMKMVSDITYIPTDEGWLYVAAIMDLCGRKIIGVSMDSNMTKQLTINALQDAVNHAGKVKGCILHSDRGSMYKSGIYNTKTAEMNLKPSMSAPYTYTHNPWIEALNGQFKDFIKSDNPKTLNELQIVLNKFVYYNNNIKIKNKLKTTPIPCVQQLYDA